MPVFSHTCIHPPPRFPSTNPAVAANKTPLSGETSLRNVGHSSRLPDTRDSRSAGHRRFTQSHDGVRNPFSTLDRCAVRYECNAHRVRRLTAWLPHSALCNVLSKRVQSIGRAAGLIEHPNQFFQTPPAILLILPNSRTATGSQSTSSSFTSGPGFCLRLIDLSISLHSPPSFTIALRKVPTTSAGIRCCQALHLFGQLLQALKNVDVQLRSSTKEEK